MRRRLADETGMTVIELLFVAVILVIVMTGLVNLFVSGNRASSDATARIAAQQNTRLALDRLEFSARCASSATLLSSGTGVTLALPANCTHSTGTVTWCVASGVLWTYTGSACSGTGNPFTNGITSAAPFSCVAPVGPLPQLAINMTVNTTGRASDGFTVADAITLRNAPPTTASTTACS
jgi:Tfp pilus assembly protein PilW